MRSVVSDVHREVESFRTGPARRRGATDPRAPFAAADGTWCARNGRLHGPRGLGRSAPWHLE